MSRNPHYIKMINSNQAGSYFELRSYKAIRFVRVCEANNRSTLATEVHHTVPVESVSHELGMRQLMFDYNNLESLCHSCHSDTHRRAFSHSKEAVQANNRRATERFADRVFEIIQKNCLHYLGDEGSSSVFLESSKNSSLKMSNPFGISFLLKLYHINNIIKLAMK